MKYIRTSKCVICGNTAVDWHGYVNIEENGEINSATAGFCAGHNKQKRPETKGCYGKYNKDKMGVLVPLVEL